jgi:hypothetical protein
VDSQKAPYYTRALALDSIYYTNLKKLERLSNVAPVSVARKKGFQSCRKKIGFGVNFYCGLEK